RSLAESYHYPAIDVLKSISRLAPVVSGRESRKAEGRVRRLMADYAGIEDYISVGAYKAGSNPRVDEAIAKREVIEAFLIQDADEKSSLAETLTMMGEISGVKIPEEEAKAYSKEKDLPPPFPGKDDEIEDTAGEATGATDRINATDGIDAVDEIGDRIDAVNGIGTTDGIDATEAAERINTIDAVNGIGATEATDRIDATGATGDAIDTTGGIDATEAAERINTIDAVNGIGATEATDRIGDEEENRQIGEDAGIPAALAQEETEGAPEESAPDLPLMDF
ncbi:MAG: hypothetical protein LBQ67_08285, partial [Treponema sp.]|nr:hypothetical protein [Treponema sp.]